MDLRYTVQFVHVCEMNQYQILCACYGSFLRCFITCLHSVFAVWMYKIVCIAENSTSLQINAFAIELYRYNFLPNCRNRVQPIIKIAVTDQEADYEAHYLRNSFGKVVRFRDTDILLQCIAYTCMFSACTRHDLNGGLLQQNAVKYCK